MATQGTTARRQIMIFAMGAMALITLATTLIVGAHYWEMLSGVFLIALVGLALPDWAAWWATYWHARATKQGQEDSRVSATCLVVSAVMSIVMILNAGAVMAVWWDDKKSSEVQSANAKAGTDLQTAKNTGNTDAIKARSDAVQKMKAAGLSDRAIRDYLKAEAERDKTKLLTSSTGETQSQSIAYASAVPDTVRKYVAFWVYIVPFLFGFGGVLAIVIAVALPGGVDFGTRTADAQQSVNQQPGGSIGFAPAPMQPVTAKQGSTTIANGGNFTPPHQ